MALWKSHCISNKFFPSLTKTLIIESKVYSAIENFDTAKNSLIDAIEIAKKMGLGLHLKLAKLDLNKVNQFIEYENMLNGYNKSTENNKSFREVKIDEAVQTLVEFNKLLLNVESKTKIKKKLS